MVGKSTFVQVEFVSNEDVRLTLGDLSKVEMWVNEAFKRLKIAGIEGVFHRVVLTNSKYGPSPFKGKFLSTIVTAEFSGKLSTRELEAVEDALNQNLTATLGVGGVSAIFSAVQYKSGAYFQ